jgi:hypothetical protein
MRRSCGVHFFDSWQIRIMDKELLNEKMGALGKKTARKFLGKARIFDEGHVFTKSSSFLNLHISFWINLNKR